MKQTVNFGDFSDAFRDMDRMENFSPEGLQALFDYIEGYEEDTGVEIELDVIALCCEYEEFENLEEFNSAHGKNCCTVEQVEDYTQVIPIPETERFIIVQF